ncbi:MAG: response regulator transcription factor [Melioribacteraceae bacterium]|nr:response regulator transcription factor [Melioribacteraceae bacterium]
MKKIFIVDDHPVVAEGLRKLIIDSGAAVVIGIAETGKACLDFLRWEKPDIIFLDINLPDTSGIDLCKEIKSTYKTIKILALTSYNEKSIIKKMIENGADGYLLKNSDAYDITEGIKEVTLGNKYFAAEVNSILRKEEPTEILLTKREKEVLMLIADGMTNNEIAEKLFISSLTVDSHRKNLITKLNARNTASLIKIAIENNFI